MKKNGKYTKKQMVKPGNLPSQLRVLDSSQRLYAPLFLASYSSSNLHLFPSKFSEKLKKFLPSLTILSPLLFSSFLCISDLSSQWSLLQPPFFVLPPCSHLFCDLFCPTPSATSKSEVDSLWLLKMWHVARWDSDTWLKMRFAKTNRGKATHA